MAIQDYNAFGGKTAYERWQESEGIPVFKSISLGSLAEVEVSPWKRTGGKGAFINLSGTDDTDDAYVLEILPGGKLNPERHLFEELIYIMKGRGATQIWQPDGAKHTFEWQEGSCFAIPLNAWHQHFNAQPGEPVRYLAVTNAPVMMNLFHNSDFIFNCPYAFLDRFERGDNIFARDGQYIDVPESVQKGNEPFPANLLETNFIADARTLPLIEYKKRGGKGRIMYFEMADATLAGHISEFPVGTYKKGHRHGPGAHVIILTGTGYSLMWREGEQTTRIDWKPGTMLVPPEMWFHQHFNTGPEPARYLVFHIRSRKYRVFRYFKSHVSTKEGGHQIEYEDEAPEIRRLFEEELRKNGVECQMPKIDRRAG